MCNTGISALRVTEEAALRGASGRARMPCPREVPRARPPGSCHRPPVPASRWSRPWQPPSGTCTSPSAPCPAAFPPGQDTASRARCRGRSARPRNRSGPHGSGWPGSVPRAQRLPSCQARTARCVRPSTAPSPAGPGQRPPHRTVTRSSREPWARCMPSRQPPGTSPGERPGCAPAGSATRRPAWRPPPSTCARPWPARRPPAGRVTASVTRRRPAVPAAGAASGSPGLGGRHRNRQPGARASTRATATGGRQDRGGNGLLTESANCWHTAHGRVNGERTGPIHGNSRDTRR